MITGGGGRNDLHALAVAVSRTEGWGWHMQEGLGEFWGLCWVTWPKSGPLQKASASPGRAWGAVCLMLVSSWSWGREQA